MPSAGVIVNSQELSRLGASWKPADVAAFLKVDPRTLRRLISSGAFPAADIVLTDKIKRWRQETIDRWIEAQASDGRRMQIARAAC
ncbi:MAG: helix-turn-helix domain-containing protein [Planctomycetes bacterium]|nr:helix-turn-helix domain-containing protein [Planctomycetota bacterium]